MGTIKYAKNKRIVYVLHFFLCKTQTGLKKNAYRLYYVLSLLLNGLIHSSILTCRCKQNTSWLVSIAQDFKKWTWDYDNIKTVLENRVSETWEGLQIETMN